MTTKSPLARAIAVVVMAAALLLVGCDQSSTLTANDLESGENAGASLAIAITPGHHVAHIGDSVQYGAVLLDASGISQGPATVTWSVADTTVAVIVATGKLMARGGGSTTVTARHRGRTRSVPVTVAPDTGTAPAPTVPEPIAPAPSAPAPGAGEPVYVAGTSLSLWYDDAESIQSTAEIYTRYATQGGESGLHLDATGGVNGSRGIRVDWSAKAGCTDDSHFIEGSFTPSQEVVVQYSVRYQPNFVFDWIGRGGPCSGNAKKLFFLWAQEGSRFDFISENHVLGVGSDYDHPLFAQQAGAAVTPEALADGQWHRITLRVRQSSTPTATDGYIHGWIDGVQRWNVNNVASHASGGWMLFKLPTTMNQGSPVNQSEWMDNFRIWKP